MEGVQADQGIGEVAGVQRSADLGPLAWLRCFSAAVQPMRGTAAARLPKHSTFNDLACQSLKWSARGCFPYLPRCFLCPLVQAVACYDIGEFARFYSQGKMVVRQLGGKNRVMELMTNADKEVAKQALQASAKLLISNWEHLGA